jgi:hypothetical protein
MCVQILKFYLLQRPPSWAAVVSLPVLAIASRAQAQMDAVNSQNFWRGPEWSYDAEPVDEFVPFPEREADEGAKVEAAPETPTPGEIRVNADYTARAAVIGDSTRLASFAKGTFLPSAIPAQGQPFYGSDARANLQGSGSAISLSAVMAPTPNYRGYAFAQLAIQEFSVGSAESNDTEVIVQQVFGTLNRLTVGLTDSEFSDPSAMPEVLDLAGPNARITVFDAGVGAGQGILSYEFLSDEPEGFEIIGSIEQAIPEIYSPPGDEPFAHYPDLVLATQYVDGDYALIHPDQQQPQFFEAWHLQWASVLRDLGSELPTGVDQNEVGWGTAFSGAWRFPASNPLQQVDRIMFSAAYGEGISHYIADLNNADAVINASGDLEALPAFAAYVAYKHEWNEFWRSTVTLSHVSLDSTVPLGVTSSPYHSGDFAAINLVYHRILSPDNPAKKIRGERFYTGIEYLFGKKETLDGAAGEAHRIVFLVALRK